MVTVGGAAKRTAAQVRVFWPEPTVVLGAPTLSDSGETRFVRDMQLLQQAVLTGETSAQVWPEKFLPRVPRLRGASSNGPKKSPAFATREALANLAIMRNNRRQVTERGVRRAVNPGLIVPAALA